MTELIRMLEKLCDRSGVVEWFEDNYTVLTYDVDLLMEISRWLTQVLGQ